MNGLISMNGENNPDDQGYLPGNTETDPSLFTIPIGVYTLHEEVAPDGYNLLEDDVQIIVTAESVSATLNGEVSDLVMAKLIDENNPEQGWMVTIKNVPGYALPATGGPGSADLLAVGLLLAEASFFLMLLWRSFRKKQA